MKKTRRLIATVVGGLGALPLLGALALAQETTSTQPILNLITHLTSLAPAEIPVEPGEDTLHDAVEEANPGDVLVLEPGVYLLTHTVLIDKDLTIRGATGKREDVHIAGALADDFDFQPEIFGDAIEDLPKWGHLLFVTDDVEKVLFRDFTIKRAPEIDAIDEEFCEANFGLNHSECMGDAIHSDGATHVEVRHVEASVNAGNGIWIDGAETATLRHILGVNNGAFGIDVDSAEDLSIRNSTFIANQVSGIEASGESHSLVGLPRADYTAKASIRHVVSKGNEEIGIEVERYRRVKIEDIECRDNREDGFDADRVSELEMDDSRFVNNLDDGIELFPVDVDPTQQPRDFPGSILLDLGDLDFEGNVGEDINFAPTEN